MTAVHVPFEPVGIWTFLFCFCLERARRFVQSIEVAVAPITEKSGRGLQTGKPFKILAARPLLWFPINFKSRKSLCDLSIVENAFPNHFRICDGTDFQVYIATSKGREKIRSAHIRNNEMC